MTKKVTKSGRPPLKRKAMTAAERQRRHRKKIAGRSRAEGGDELHETPACAVHALLEAEELPQCLWEPACGYGAIVRILRAAGRAVVASDLRAYDTPDQDFVQDFLATTAVPEGVEAMVTNPAFLKNRRLCPAWADARPESDSAAAARLARIDHEEPQGCPRGRSSRPGPCVPQASAEDAPLRLDGKESRARRGTRLVCVGHPASRPADAALALRRRPARLDDPGKKAKLSAG